MSAKRKATERAQAKLERLTERGARPRVIARQKARVERRAFVAHERAARAERARKAAV